MKFLIQLHFPEFCAALAGAETLRGCICENIGFPFNIALSAIAVIVTYAVVCGCLSILGYSI